MQRLRLSKVDKIPPFVLPNEFKIINLRYDDTQSIKNQLNSNMDILINSNYPLLNVIKELRKLIKNGQEL